MSAAVRVCRGGEESGGKSGVKANITTTTTTSRHKGGRKKKLTDEVLAAEDIVARPHDLVVADEHDLRTEAEEEFVVAVLGVVDAVWMRRESVQLMPGSALTCWVLWL